MTRRYLAIVGVTLFAVAWASMPDFATLVGAFIGLNALVVMGLVLLTGIGGMTSFGQATFMAVGAYATAWMCTSPVPVALTGMPAASGSLPWIGLLLGLVVTFVLAWVLGAATLRLSGHYMTLCTMAWALSLYFLFGNLEFLGGQTGLSGIPPIVLASVSLGSPRRLGVIIWALVFLVLWALTNLLDSREGRAIRSLKAGRIMAESMGINTARYRVKLFVLSALLAGLAGWLYAHLQRFVNASPFSLNAGIDYLFMAVVGGAEHLGGAVIGAAIVPLLREKLQDILPGIVSASGNLESIVFGLLILIVLQRFSLGIWPTISRVIFRFLRSEPPCIDVSEYPVTDYPAVAKDLVAGDEPFLETRELTKRFGGLVANEAISLTVQGAEVHVLIGPNGAGKSTFFNMISGVDEPTSGEVILMGKSMKGLPAREFATRGLSRTFQHVRLLGSRSVLDNVALGGHRRGCRGWISAMLRLNRREEAAMLAEARFQIERCGLGEHTFKPAASLALGQQRIVEIARALAGRPAVLLLDEPAAGLRYLEKQALVTLLAELRAQGLGILVVEHDMEFVMKLADRITVLEFGRVIASGSPQMIQANPRVLEAYLGGAEDIDSEVAQRHCDASEERAITPRPVILSDQISTTPDSVSGAGA